MNMAGTITTGITYLWKQIVRDLVYYAGGGVDAIGGVIDAPPTTGDSAGLLTVKAIKFADQRDGITNAVNQTILMLKYINHVADGYEKHILAHEHDSTYGKMTDEELKSSLSGLYGLKHDILNKYLQFHKDFQDVVLRGGIHYLCSYYPEEGWDRPREVLMTPRWGFTSDQLLEIDKSRDGGPYEGFTVDIKPPTKEETDNCRKADYPWEHVSRVLWRNMYYSYEQAGAPGLPAPEETKGWYEFANSDEFVTWYYWERLGIDNMHSGVTGVNLFHEWLRGRAMANYWLANRSGIDSLKNAWDQCKAAARAAEAAANMAGGTARAEAAVARAEAAEAAANMAGGAFSAEISRINSAARAKYSGYVDLSDGYSGCPATMVFSNVGNARMTWTSGDYTVATISPWYVPEYLWTHVSFGFSLHSLTGNSASLEITSGYSYVRGWFNTLTGQIFETAERPTIVTEISDSAMLTLMGKSRTPVKRPSYPGAAIKDPITPPQGTWRMISNNRAVELASAASAWEQAQRKIEQYVQASDNAVAVESASRAMRVSLGDWQLGAIISTTEALTVIPPKVLTALLLKLQTPNLLALALRNFALVGSMGLTGVLAQYKPTVEALVKDLFKKMTPDYYKDPYVPLPNPGTYMRLQWEQAKKVVMDTSKQNILQIYRMNGQDLYTYYDYITNTVISGQTWELYNVRDHIRKYTSDGATQSSDRVPDIGPKKEDIKWYFPENAGFGDNIYFVGVGGAVDPDTPGGAIGQYKFVAATAMFDYDQWQFAPYIIHIGCKSYENIETAFWIYAKDMGGQITLFKNDPNIWGHPIRLNPKPPEYPKAPPLPNTPNPLLQY